MSSVYAVMKNTDIFGLAFGFISAIWFFAKYTNHCSNNLIKSLPAKDKHLFISDFTMGFVTFVIPMLIGFLVQSVAGIIITSHSVTESIYETMGVTFGFILNFVFGYTVAVFCFAVTTGVMESAITFIVLNFIPSVVSSFVLFGKTCVLGLFRLEDNISLKLDIKSTYDILYHTMIPEDKQLYNTTYLDMLKISGVIIVIGAIVTLLAYLAFIKLRSPDKSGSRTKTIISVIAVCSMSFYCGFLILFFKRTRITPFNMMTILPTMLAISFVVYFMANAINHKSLRIPLKTMLPYTGVLALLTVLGVYYFTAGFGAATYVPQISEIESVTLNYKDSNYDSTVDRMKNSVFTNLKILAQKDVQVQFPITYTDDESIKMISDYHKGLVEKYQQHGLVETSLQSDSHFPDDNPRTVITYTLKNGSKVTRYYNYNGNDEILANLITLKTIENSVTESETKAIGFMNGTPKENVNHTIMISPICSDNTYQSFHITDAQLRNLVKAIYLDEQNLSDESIIGSVGSDVCVMVLVPDSSYEAGYFSSMIRNINGSLYRSLIKSCYTNTQKVLREIPGVAEAIDASKDAQIKQIFAGPFGTAIKGGWNWRNYFIYDFEQLYHYDYYAATKIYNTDLLLPDEMQYISGPTCNNDAIKYLISKLKLSSDNLNGGVTLMLNKSVTHYDSSSYGDYVPTSEWHMAIGQRIYYVTYDDWNAFLQMCK